VYYKVDSTKRTYAEYWRLAPSLSGFLYAALHKLLRAQLPHTFGIRRPEALNRHIESDLPSPARERLAPVIAKCEELHLTFQFYSSVDAMIGSRLMAYSAAMLHLDGSTWATAITVLGRNKARPATFCCFSLLYDGRYVVTSDHAWKLNPHPGDIVEYLVGAQPEAISTRHSERITEPGHRPICIRPEELTRTILTREQRHVDHQVERGVYVPMTDAEVARITRKR
jgi:hypothetical protein